MSLVNLLQSSPLHAVSIPVSHTATTGPALTYNPSTSHLPRRRSTSLNTSPPLPATCKDLLLVDKKKIQIDDDDDDKHDQTLAMKQQVTHDMLSIHSTKHEPLIGAAAAPALPEKSALRASRLLATLPQKLVHDRPVLTPAAPHFVYLSSEDDMSSSADDLSDLDSFNSDVEESLATNSSQAELARLVPVIFSGKPSVINLTSRSVSLAHLDTSTPDDDDALRTTSTEPSLQRIRSASSATSSIHSYYSYNHPPRLSSITSSLDKQRHKFHVGSFASWTKTADDEMPRTPRTPTAMFSRAIKLVKKRSRPTLSTANSRDAVIVPMQQVGEEREAADCACSCPTSPRKSFSRGSMLATKSAQYPVPLPVPSSSASAKDGLRGFSLTRRMSVRA